MTSWTDKQKTLQSGGDEEIRTPDGYQILLGASENLILLWQVAFNNWSQKVRNAASAFTLKTKTTI
jgi:hypothetical protein